MIGLFDVVSIRDVQIFCKIYPGARAGIRTRVSGMKTRDDGPGYTTRANIPAVLHLIDNRWPSKP